MTNPIVIKAYSLKSPAYHHRKSLLQSKNKTNKKRRPSTWNCHSTRLSNIRHYTISPRVSKWCEEHNKRQRLSVKSSNNGSFLPHPFNKRQTIATISTLTTHTNSDTTTLNNTTVMNDHICNVEENIFHIQSTLFLFGFLCFPCWWVGGYYLQIDQDGMNFEEKQVMTVHPSLLANGKTCSKILWIPVVHELNTDTATLFYKWNRLMSLVSIALILFILSLLVWYYVVY